MRAGAAAAVVNHPLAVECRRETGGEKRFFLSLPNSRFIGSLGNNNGGGGGEGEEISFETKAASTEKYERFQTGKRGGAVKK